MKLFGRAKKENPAWLDNTREFCRGAGITIAAWGPNTLVVEAKSPERAAEITAQLANLGFRTVQDADDAYAGLLSLSHPD
jgi:hypothetical protein